ncbi:MAG: NAAT family transporter [bacterium]|nr:NAAT family transporter [bacterium]
MSEITYYIKIFIAIIVLVNPVEGIPLFLSKTHTNSREEKIAIAKKTAFAVFIILIISLFLGRYVLELFGISIASFTLAGGIIIFLISIQMVIGKTDSGEKSLPGDQTGANEDVAIVPLATPLLAGPGAISSVIVYGSRSPGLWEDLILSIIVIVVAFVVWLALNASTRMEKALNETGIKVMTKISGLLVTAIAIELIFSSLLKIVPALAK